MRNLKLLLVQTDLFWEDKYLNLNKIGDLLKEASFDADLIVLPEMFSSGFSMQVAETANSMEGDVVDWMREQATKYNTTIVGSINIKEAGKYYNRLLLVSQEGVLAQYDKRHLFSLAGENEVFAAGSESLICPIVGWRIHFQICYDLRFPVWSRNQDNYDLLVNVANWPARRIYAWNHLLIARAIENQSYVVGVNRTGLDGHGIPHIGNSCVIDPMGEVLWRAGEEVVVKAIELSADFLLDTREKLPFLRDRDNFEMK